MYTKKVRLSERAIRSSQAQSRVFDRGTSIHDYRQAGLLRAVRGVEMDHAELAPQDTRAFGDRVLDDLRHVFRPAKYVDHLDSLGYRRQVRIALLSERIWSGDVVQFL